MFSRHALAAAVVTAALVDVAHAQATNPPYIASFPSVSRVMQVMKVADERETAVRQIGTFWQLEQIIRQLSGNREFRGFLPDEAKVIGDYQVAAYNVAQAIDKKYPGRYNTGITVSDYTPYRFMRSDRRFGVEGIETFKTFLTPFIQGQFAQTVGGDMARAQARQKADQEAIASIGTVGPPAPKSKLAEEQAGIRRCVESGRSETQCMMEGLGKSAMGMMNDAMPGVANLMKKKEIRGLRMSGAYGTQNGFHLAFYPDNVSIGCDEVVAEMHDYTVNTDGAAVTITIPIQPRPVVFSLRSDGRLVGPGITSMTGQVQVGVQYGTRTWSDGHTEPISRPVYETQTRRCSTTLAATGSVGDGTISGGVAEMTSLLFGNADKNEKMEIPVGLRVSGEWGSQSAIDLEFRPEGVVVGCREATIIRPYTVQVGANGVAINVQNGSAPFALSYTRDGRITGSGAMRVDGRVVTGTNGEGGITYAPRTATCTLGPLSPAPPQ
jgi:hypothetical protein